MQFVHSVGIEIQRLKAGTNRKKHNNRKSVPDFDAIDKSDARCGETQRKVYRKWITIIESQI